MKRKKKKKTFKTKKKNKKNKYKDSTDEEIYRNKEEYSEKINNISKSKTNLLGSPVRKGKKKPLYEEFQDLEKKMNILYYDKINLEEKMKNGLQTLEINEIYTQIKNFYEKFINALNEKLAENTEQNMIIKFHLKELFETNQQNSKNLNSVDELLKNEYNKNERERLNTERNNFKKEIPLLIDNNIKNDLKIKNKINDIDKTNTFKKIEETTKNSIKVNKININEKEKIDISETIDDNKNQNENKISNIC